MKTRPINNQGPPRWSVRFFRWYCNPEFTDELLGDLLELYHRRKDTLGKTRADLLFILNVFSFLQPFFIKRNSNPVPSNNLVMIENYLTIALRIMSRHKMFILINVVGLSIAIACCIMTYYSYDYNERFDSNHANAPQLYRVNSLHEFQNKITETAYVPIPLAELVRQNVGDINNVIRYSPGEGSIRLGTEIFNEKISFVDDAFFNTFTFEFTEGNGNDLRDKTRLFISDKQANTFFGNEPALGKQVTQILPGNKLREFTIGGVFKSQPSNSSFNDNIFTAYENYFDIAPELEKGTRWEFPATLFLQVNDPSRIAIIENQLKRFAEINNKTREDFIIKEFKLDPFNGMAVRDTELVKEGRRTREALTFPTIVSTAVISFLILLVACFNLTNTGISLYSTRLKEIGIRKVLGGLRSQLIFQFIGETLLICFLSVVAGMTLTHLFLLPAFNDLWPEIKLTTNYFGQPEFLIFMLITMVVAALLAGAYPAFYISKFQPISILKDKVALSGTNFFSRSLLTLQYAFSLITIVCSLAFVGNAHYQKSFDLGFNHDGVIYTKIENGNEFEVFKNALAGNPEIISIAGSKDHVMSSGYNSPIKHEGKELEVDVMDVGHNYLQTAGFTLIDGRDFAKDSQTDYNESIIVTEKLASLMGWDQPLGKEITLKDSIRLTVIGMVKNAYTYGLWAEMKPLMLRYTPQKNYSHFLVSTSPENLVSTNQFMKEKWTEIFPNRIYQSRYMDDNMALAARANDNLVKTFGFLGIVSMILSVTGLYTLVSLNILKKMKEIGVRKVFGASTLNITRIINKEFVIILMIASLAGSYLGYLMSTFLMTSIWKYSRPIEIMIIALAVLLLFVVSAATIVFKVTNAARMSPIKILRDE